jgi:hypothetical protein
VLPHPDRGLGTGRTGFGGFVTVLPCGAAAGNDGRADGCTCGGASDIFGGSALGLAKVAGSGSVMSGGLNFSNRLVFLSVFGFATTR